MDKLDSVLTQAEMDIIAVVGQSGINVVVELGSFWLAAKDLPDNQTTRELVAMGLIDLKYPDEGLYVLTTKGHRVYQLVHGYEYPEHKKDKYVVEGPNRCLGYGWY